MSKTMLIVAALAAAALMFTAAPFEPAHGETPARNLFLEVRPDQTPPDDERYLETVTVTLDMLSLLEPAPAIWLNLPAEEPELVHLVHWSPRRGYINVLDPDDPTGQNTITIPDPNAAPEDFWWRWYGRSDNYTVALTTVDGVVAGRISSARHRFALDPRPDRTTRLGRVNSEFWQTHPGDSERLEAKSFSPLQSKQTQSPLASEARTPTEAAPQSGASGWDPFCTEQVPGGQHVIDVLLLYTTGILFEYGTPTGVHAVLQSALDDANQALRNSGIIHIVFSPRGPEFLPNAPGPGYDTLQIVEAVDTLAGVERISGQPVLLFPGNPYVAGRRDAMWADVVALARKDSSVVPSCGYSYINRWVTNSGYLTEPGPDFEKLAYFAFDPGCNADRLNFAHELGHQMGLEHDRSNFQEWQSGGHQPSCPWSYAYKRSSGDARFRFRTIMAYWQNVSGASGGQPDCGDDVNCPLIDAYSTPHLEWAGVPASGGPPPFGLQPVGTVPGASPIGLANPPWPTRPAHNSDTLQRIAPIAAAYRARPEVIFADGFR